MTVIGIDGWKGKWVGVSLTDGSVDEIRIYEDLDEVAALGEEVKAIGIDVPIGLPEKPPRAADKEARKFVGARSSSVFASPPAFCLDPKWNVYREALQECRTRFKSGISAQGFALMKNIRAAAIAAAKNPGIFEVHPEVSFCAMNRGMPLRFTKKSWNGQHERRKLLAENGIAIPDHLPEEVGRVPVDDLLDAAAAAWSAKRFADKTAKSFPKKSPETQDQQIWY